MNNREKLATYDTQRLRKTRQKHNTICVGHHYAQTLRYMLYCYPNDSTVSKKEVLVSLSNVNKK
jgi:hypothetical protein